MAWGARNLVSTQVYYVEPDAHGPDHKVSAVKRKQPLREEHYKPVMPFSRSRRSSSTHDRAVLKTKLAIMARKEGIPPPPLEAVLVASNGPRGEALSSEFADAIIYRYQVGWGASIDACFGVDRSPPADLVSINDRVGELR